MVKLPAACFFTRIADDRRKFCFEQRKRYKKM